MSSYRRRQEKTEGDRKALEGEKQSVFDGITAVIENPVTG